MRASRGPRLAALRSPVRARLERTQAATRLPRRSIRRLLALTADQAYSLRVIRFQAGPAAWVAVLAGIALACGEVSRLVAATVPGGPGLVVRSRGWCPACASAQCRAGRLVKPGPGMLSAPR